MKKVYCFIFLVALCSCSKEGQAIQEQQEERHSAEFAVSVEPVDGTKTQFDSDRNVVWSTGNTCALMYHNGTSLQSVTLTYDKESKSLKGEIGESQDVYYAAYPRLKYCTDGGQVSMLWDNATSRRYYEQTLAINQKIAGTNTFANGAAMAFAIADKNASSLEFKNLCALFRVTIPADLENASGASVSVLKINMSPIKADESFRGTYRVSCTKKEEDGFLMTYKQDTSGDRFITIMRESGSFAAGDYYLCAPAMTSTYGLKVDIYFTDNTVHSVYAYGQKAYERNKIYNLGTLKYGAEKSILVTDQLAEKPSWITNADHVSIAYSPSIDMKNQNATALKVSKLGSEGTTGFFKITYCDSANPPAGTVDHNECKKYNGMRLKLYCEKAKDVYFFAEFGGSSKRLPSRVNGIRISNDVEYNEQIKADAWNILEYDLKDFDSSKPTANYYQSFGMRPFCNSEGGNSTVSNRIAYIDDIELIWK